MRRLLMAAVPVIAAAGLAAAVVLGGGAIATPRVDSATPAAHGGAGPVPARAVGAAVPSWLRDAAGPGPQAGVVGDAAAAARRLREQEEQEARTLQALQQREREAGQRTGSSGGGVCDLDGPPRFDDPAHPNEITNRNCGFVDGQGRERSHDPWIDGQLLTSDGE